MVFLWFVNAMLKLTIVSWNFTILTNLLYVSYIIYVDAKNLQGHSVMQLLPTELHDWASIKDSEVIKETLSKDEVQIIENNNFSLGKNNFFLI